MSVKRFWLLKTEPGDFAWDDMLRLRVTPWDGVKNPQALSYLRMASVGDLAFFYHTGKEKVIKGVVKITKTTGTVADGLVDVEVAYPLKRSISLQEIKSSPELCNMVILRQPRLSVAPVTEEEWLHLIELSNN
ncbi:EVE domain-containing protein [Candidatus Anaplasma sp. TIGMIC]|uniref:EVE domain-containing protein n=1 Tax=Candidatus Anaplasma sp. TIGMIC TaxID=3020713 RepID=UPI00232F9F30|nr:EVE domain-containing protein [Candidatus Anaplasma sp. TIGMIC]MDB1135514.1 EVE domain-containing protein [Candidatus Anaplasma sp. TIGMIC]